MADIANNPHAETLRLETLQRLGVLDSEPEQQFDDLTELAAKLCGTPIAVLSLDDRDRVWFKSRVGIDIKESPREHSFCAQSGYGSALMEVPDAMADERFRSSPYVTGPPFVRAYAGMPLMASNGIRIGTLCVLDRQPRQWTDEQRSGLALLARQVVSRLESRRGQAGDKPPLSENFMRATLDAMPDIIAIVSGSGDIVYVNQSWSRFAENNEGIGPMENAGVGTNYLDTCDRSTQRGSRDAREVAEALRSILDGSRQTFGLEFPGHAPGQRRWFRMRITAFGEGVERHAVITHVDVTERRELQRNVRALNQSLEVRVAERTKDLKEALATVGARELELLESAGQLRALTTRLEKVRDDERAHISREVHDELGQMMTALKIELSLLGQGVGERRDMPADDIVSALQRLEQLVDQTIDSVRSIARQLRPEVVDALGLLPAIEWHAKEFGERSGIDCRIDSKGKQPGLSPGVRSALFRIAQEAMTNVARHAQATRIDITLAFADAVLELRIADNGKGIDPGSLVGTSSLGVVGMRERAMMVGAEFRIDGVPGKGTTITVRMPVANEEGNQT